MNGKLLGHCEWENHLFSPYFHTQGSTRLRRYRWHRYALSLSLSLMLHTKEMRLLNHYGMAKAFGASHIMRCVYFRGDPA